MLIINNDNVDGLFLANMYLFIEYIYIRYLKYVLGVRHITLAKTWWLFYH